MIPVFLVNPRAGASGDALVSQCEKLVAQSEARGLKTFVHYLGNGQLRDELFKLIQANGERVVVMICGGDGTVSHVLRELSAYASPPPFGIVPLGTGNDVARFLGWFELWSRLGGDGVLSGMLSAKVRSFDLWEMVKVHGKSWPSVVFCAYLGLGIDGHVVRCYHKALGNMRALGSSRFVREALYGLCGIKALLESGMSQCHGGFSLSLRDEGGVERTVLPKGGAQVLVSNIGNYMGGVRLFREARSNDGALELYAWESPFGYASFGLLGHLSMGGRIPKAPLIGGGKEVVVEVSRELAVQADGEPLVPLSPGVYRIRIRRSIPVLVPPIGQYVKEQSKSWEAEEKGCKIPIPEPSFFEFEFKFLVFMYEKIIRKVKKYLNLNIEEEPCQTDEDIPATP